MTATNRTSKLRNTFLQLAPLLCAAMVIGIHSYGAGELYIWTVTSRVAGFFAHGLFMAAVPTFLIISGFLFFKNVMNLGQIWDKQKRRCVSVFLPFVSWTTFYYIVYALAGRIGIVGLKTAVDVSLSGLLKAVVCYQYVYPFWFMSQLILYIAIAPVIFWTLKRKSASLAVLAIMTVLGLLGWNWNEGLSGLDRMVFAPNFFGYYYLGAFLATNQEKMDSAIQKLMRIPVCVSVIGLIGSCFLESYIFDTDAVFNNRIMVPVIVLLTLSVLLNIAKSLEGSRLLHSPLLKTQTMAVYGVSPIVGMAIGKLMSGNSELFQMLVLFIGTFVMSCVCAMIVSRIPVLNFLFNGNRKARW